MVHHGSWVHFWIRQSCDQADKGVVVLGPSIVHRPPAIGAVAGANLTRPLQQGVRIRLEGIQ